MSITNDPKWGEKADKATKRRQEQRAIQKNKKVEPLPPTHRMQPRVRDGGDV